MLLLQFLLAHGLVQRRGPVLRIAVVTDHHAIVKAQRKHNGYGGLGRGYCLNRLFALTTHLLHTEATQVVFFFISGTHNPADELSRNFGEGVGSTGVTRSRADDLAVPLLRTTWSPMCEPERTDAVVLEARRNDGSDKL